MADKDTAQKSSDGQKDQGGSGTQRKRPERRMKAGKVGERAVEELAELTGREAETVTGLQWTDDGWTVQIEVVESRRIPDSVDVMGLYEVQMTATGDLSGFQRQRRYLRGQTRDGGSE